MADKIIRDVPIKDLRVGRNIRELDQQRVKQYAESIKQIGQVEPSHARYVDGKWEVTEGFHRLAGCELAGKDTFAVIVDAGNASDSEVLRLQLISNCLRENLSPLQTARGIQEYMEVTGCNASQAAADLAFSISKVSELRKLLTLQQDIIDQVEAGTISLSGACELGRVEDAGRRAELAQRMAEGRLTRDGLAGTRKAAKRGNKQGDSTATRVTAILSEGRSITVAGEGLTLDRFIGLIEELLAKARRERSRGTELSTFISLLRDQARAK
jgi:ParB family chromosome partitioning protein